MTLNSNYKVVLKGKGHHDEGVAGTAVYPGEAVRMAADGQYDPETLTAAMASGRGLTLVKENGIFGETIEDQYAIGDTLLLYKPLPGDHVNVLVKAGEDIDVGDFLDVEGGASGKFIEVASSGTAEYVLPLTQARVHDAMATSLGPALAATSAATTTFPVDLADARIFDGVDDLLPAAAVDDDMGMITGTPGTDAPTLQSIDFGEGSTDEKCAFLLELPADYVAGQPVTVRVRAGMITAVSDGTATVDVQAYETDGDGAVGADLCTTAAQSINSLTKANKDFTVTPTGLAPGDQLIVVVSFGGTDSGTAVVVSEISAVSLIVGTTAAVAATAGDDMALVTGTPGTDAPTLQSADFGGGIADEKCAFEFVLPQEYRAGSALALRIRAAMLTTLADDSCTIDAEVWKDAGDGTVGSDLCATDAQDMNSLTAANYDFTITPTGMLPGDRLIIRISFAGVDAGDLGAMIAEISKVAVRLGSAVAGRLQALEDSGGALAAAALVACEVMSV